MRRKFMMGVVVLVVACALGSCTSAPSDLGDVGGVLGGTAELGVASPAVAPKGDPGAVCAVGDSITNESHVGIAGWPNVPPVWGTTKNFGVFGATASALAQWSIDNAARCSGGIFFEAGLNDLAQGATSSELEATYTYLVGHVGVPVHIIAITPYVKGGGWAYLQPERLDVNAWLDTNLGSITIDCTSALATPSGWLRPEFSIDSFVHLTATGEAALANCVYDATH
jgi:hypothetical protein